MIPEAAVEAAADLIVQGDMGDCECRRSPYDKHDVNPPCSTRRRAIRTARAALEAAAPNMLAAGFDAYEAAPYEIRLTADGKSWEPFKVNPYRPTP